MSLLTGTIDSGWEKSITKDGLISYHYQLTHIAGTSSNQVTGYLPSEVINHLFKQFSNLHIYVEWGSGTKTTTLNLLVLGFHTIEVIQTKEIFASASHDGAEKAAMIIPKNLYSSDGAFLETTNIISPKMGFQDLASSGNGTNTVDITLVYAPETETDASLKTMGDVFRGF